MVFLVRVMASECSSIIATLCCHSLSTASQFLPVLMHMQSCDDESPLMAPFLPSSSDAHSDPEDLAVAVRNHSSGNAGSIPSTRWRQSWELVHEVVLPVAILLIGVGFSVAALYVAVLPMLGQ